MPPSKPPPRFQRSSGPASQASSVHRDAGSHTPFSPSRLWQSHEPGSSSPEDNKSGLWIDSAETGAEDPIYSPRMNPVVFEDDGMHPILPSNAAPLEDSADTHMEGALEEPSDYEADAHTHLLEFYDQGPACGNKNCNHGTFSPRPEVHRHAMSYDSQFDFRNRREGSVIDDATDDSGTPARGMFGTAVVKGMFGRKSAKKMSTTQWLAKRHGVKDTRLMYVVLHLAAMILLFTIQTSNVAALIR